MNDSLLKRNHILMRRYAANEQYSTRECLEISGILDSVSNINLEGGETFR